LVDAFGSLIAEETLATIGKISVPDQIGREDCGEIRLTWAIKRMG
jgi:hypothetical protein